jgi:hypothetical protein
MLTDENRGDYTQNPCSGHSECNGDLYEAAGAADATACSGIGSW